jgi:N-ethylmaleimide reductase
MSDSDPINFYSYVLEALSSRKIGFLEVTEIFTGDASNDELRDKFYQNYEKKTLRALLRHKFNGSYMVNYKQDFETGNQIIAAGEADLISYGTLYIANADLVEKFATGKSLASVFNADPSKLWTHYFYG